MTLNNASTTKDLYAKLLPFLLTAFARKDGRQCTGVDLLYAPGDGYRDEEIRNWAREEDPEIFDSFAYVESLVSTILEIAEREADTKAPGKHRFIVRTHQHLGGRATMSFPIYQSDNSNEDNQMADKKKTATPRKGMDGWKGSTAPKSTRDTPDDGDQPLSPRKRARLLARVAGNIASGIMQAPSESTATPDAIAEVAVDIGEAILQKIGL